MDDQQNKELQQSEDTTETPAKQSEDTTETPETPAKQSALSRFFGPRLSRRRLFTRTAVAAGAVATLGGGAVVLAAQSAQNAHPPVSNTTMAGMSGMAGSVAPVNSTPALDAAPQLSSGGTLREYWIQADAFSHNLVPTGLDAMSGMRYTPNQTTYWALGYRAYTANWQSPLPGNADIGENAGIPGPVIRASVGDTIRIHFRNNDTYYKFVHSMHPHGVRYTPENDGTWTAAEKNKPGVAVKVGESFTYEWTAIASSVGSWPYHDHSMPATIPGSTSTSNEMGASNGIMELGAELGLYGMIVITDENTPKVDREIILCFNDLYETDIPQIQQDFDCFNGYAFLGNTPTFEVKVGERVRWRVMALGKDFHVFHLHGHRWLFNMRYDDSIVFGPATTITFDYVEDNPGTWLYHCHVTDHMMGGMIGYYIAKP